MDWAAAEPDHHHGETTRGGRRSAACSHNNVKTTTATAWRRSSTTVPIMPTPLARPPITRHRNGHSIHFAADDVPPPLLPLPLHIPLIPAPPLFFFPAPPLPLAPPPILPKIIMPPPPLLETPLPAGALLRRLPHQAANLGCSSDLAGATNSDSFPIARRPDAGGTEGFLIPLIANLFLVRFDPAQIIYHYDVDITPSPSRTVARLLKRRLVQDNAPALRSAQPAFDGRRNMYSTVEFESERLEIFVSLADDTSPWNGSGPVVGDPTTARVYAVSIRLVGKLSGDELSKYLFENDDDRGRMPQDYLQVLDVVLREGPSETCASVGRSLYTTAMGAATDVGGGAVALRGFFQTLRPTRQGLALNVDLSVAVFHDSIPVIAYLQKRCELLRDLPERKTIVLTDAEHRAAARALRNVRVAVSYRDGGQTYCVRGLTERPTKELTFLDRATGGGEVTVVGYFKRRYCYEIKYCDLPCLQIGRSKPCYLPMELCVVAEGQRFVGKLTDEQAARVLKMSCQAPGERGDAIKRVVDGPFGPLSGSYADQFKLQVSRQPTQLSGRVLLPPKLRLGDGGLVRDVVPNRQDRQWSLLDSQVTQGSKIGRWALLSFGGKPEHRACIPRFIAELSSRCVQLGVLLNSTTVVKPMFEGLQTLSNVTALEAKLSAIRDVSAGKLELIVCIMERRHRGYADLKRIAETSVGVMTQCCLYANVIKVTPQFLSNLAIKINAKLGGCNVALFKSLPMQLPRLFADEEPVMLMGADVTHPHPLDDSSPSVAAVVGTLNWPEANKYASRMRSQTHRKETIEHLTEMAGELVAEFTQTTGVAPRRVLFFRDGVSETQFKNVLAAELPAIRKACSGRVAVTFVVVQKRHHTRLFWGAGGGKNVPPGTVVDAAITHPREFDFYLCSHWGAKGTSRPAHYRVLWDDNKFSSDELQRLVHSLCYTFARCTKPVSLVPPAYYAHLVAYRGRLYLERQDVGGAAKCGMLYRTSAPMPTAPLPEIKDSVKKLMFYC